ncbi:metal-dependent hydrolase [Thecamonas trahens ATCC 50062]|uniref:Metal-dependent hydrolase n=1 Tax=Thecamonas trahens ATCC 50062 TaxID=461836 RepID=A0A0L0DLG2_THETB|nr:metal-dependent hydrolase [Thecamonas trahens ATCC 50062]KNC52233.1 metal-dependent hydrolase [Thecamonas trahens ATCC 50062]|eukprot:XP_013762235.1 metal-dependent hydrolase [Thecamonas trahens ATCC 50062]
MQPRSPPGPTPMSRWLHFASAQWRLKLAARPRPPWPTRAPIRCICCPRPPHGLPASASTTWSSTCRRWIVRMTAAASAPIARSGVSMWSLTGPQTLQPAAARPLPRWPTLVPSSPTESTGSRWALHPLLWTLPRRVRSSSTFRRRQALKRLSRRMRHGCGIDDAAPSPEMASDPWRASPRPSLSSCPWPPPPLSSPCMHSSPCTCAPSSACFRRAASMAFFRRIRIFLIRVS